MRVRVCVCVCVCECLCVRLCVFNKHVLSYLAFAMENSGRACYLLDGRQTELINEIGRLHRAPDVGSTVSAELCVATFAACGNTSSI